MKSESNTGPVAWMAGNPVAANLLMAVFLIGGIISMLFVVKKEVFPEISSDTVTVRVVYPGASPEEVEKGIVLSIEESIRTVDGVKEIRSTAAEGYALVVAELHSNIDQSKASQDIKSEIDRITTFPESIERPVVTLDIHRRPVMSVAVYGDADRRSLFNLAEMLRDHFLADPEVSQIDLSGTGGLEISIEVSVENLRRYGLTIYDVASMISAASVEMPAGAIRTSSKEILVRMTERRDYADEFGNIPVITGAEGSRILLRDIATISDGFEETDRLAWFDGKSAIMLDIFRVGDETPVSVSDAINKMIQDIQNSLPYGISIKVLDDRADIYRQRMSLLVRNGIMGIILVMLLLGLFLEMRLAFWVMMGIPVSFLATAMIMPALGLSLNMITMFAFIVALGIVVDDAIVIGENIYHCHQDGMSFIDAAVFGTREVATPVSFSILTNIAAFIPLALLPGSIGKILWMLPMIVISAFVFSWIESVFILPAHLGHVSAKPRKGFINKYLHEQQQKFSRWFLSSVRKHYDPLIRTALSHRYFVLAVALSLLTLTLAYVQSGRMGFEIFPRVESDYAFAFARLPYGTAVANTEEVTRKIISAAMEVIAESGRAELSEGIFADIGKNGGHTTEVSVFLAPPEIRGNIMSTQQFVDRWREKVGRIPGVEAISFLSDRGGPGGGASLDVELRHRDMEVLRQASSELAANLGTIARVFDIEDGFQPGKEQLDFTITPAGQSLGFTASEIALRLRGFYEGTEALRQQRGRNEIKIKVRLPREQRVSEHDLETIVIRTPDGGEAPVSEILQISRQRAYTTINRRNGMRTVSVTANIIPRYATGDVIRLLDAETLPRLMENYPGLTFSYEGRQADTRESLQTMYVMIPLTLVVIYAMLAVPFRSYLQPLIIMSTIPFGLVGAVLGHMIMGYALSLFSIIGMLALSGVVVNDSLVLIDFANRKRQVGCPPSDAISDAGIQRFRPILLTTLTTFGGLMPMIFETSRQARFLIPIALSIGYGILFATLISLIVVPCLYMVIEDAKELVRK